MHVLHVGHWRQGDYLQYHSLVYLYTIWGTIPIPILQRILLSTQLITKTCKTIFTTSIRKHLLFSCYELKFAFIFCDSVKQIFISKLLYGDWISVKLKLCFPKFTLDRFSETAIGGKKRGETCWKNDSFWSDSKGVK